ncbi:hypothetical protein Tco_0397027 [Tanacetum coccineum]
MASTRASISKASKRPNVNIIPPKQLFVDLTHDDTKTPSPTLQLSSPSAPNAPSKIPSTKDTFSSSIDYIPKSPTSSTSLSPNGYLNPPTSPPPRVSPPPPTQENASMDITLTLSPITPFNDVPWKSYSELRTIVEVAPMAECTMEELLRAPTEGYREAIILPEINADHFEIKTNLLQLVQANPFYGRESENPHAHINCFKRITSTLRFRNVPNDVIKLIITPPNLSVQQNVEYPRALLYGSVAQDMRTTTNVSF